MSINPHKRIKFDHDTESNQHFQYYKNSDIDAPKDVVNVIVGPNITEIRRCAFKNCTNLESISIPNSIATIGVSAFMNCSSLTSISIPSSVRSIGAWAFSGCSSLTSITIPNSITNIERAFPLCTSLEYIHIPNSIKNIRGAFSKCSSLKSISIPNSVTQMLNSFTHCRSLSSIVIPDSVTNIDYAFTNCTSLTSIVLPKSVTNIDYGFRDCTSLTSIIIPNSVTRMVCAFQNCTSLSSIFIPNSVTNINKAFNRCTSLSSIVIPDSIITIFYAFQDCTTLNQRRRNGINYDFDTEHWLQHRFDNLPIHKVCYDIDVTIDILSSTISKYHDTSSFSVDAMDMTALHILCCNPNVTPEMIEILKANSPEEVNLRDVMGRTPLMMFLKCNGCCTSIEEQNNLLSIHDLLELGLTGHILEYALPLLAENTYLPELENINEVGLKPFMVAAALSQCRLDAVYMLAIKRPDFLRMSS